MSTESEREQRLAIVREFAQSSPYYKSMGTSLVELEEGHAVLRTVIQASHMNADGIVLVIAMLVTPAATANLLVRRLHHVIFVAVGLALAAAVIGLYVSYHAGVASGASIVLVATAFFIIALLVAPRRGVFARRRFQRARRDRFQAEAAAAEQAAP